MLKMVRVAACARRDFRQVHSVRFDKYYCTIYNTWQVHQIKYKLCFSGKKNEILYSIYYAIINIRFQLQICLCSWWYKQACQQDNTASTVTLSGVKSWNIYWLGNTVLVGTWRQLEKMRSDSSLWWACW